MNQILTIALQEMKLGIKGIGYWVLVVLVDFVLLYTLYDYHWFSLRSSQFFYLLFVFWNIGMLARDWRTGTAEMFNALPCRDWELFVGRALGSFFLLTLLNLQIFFIVSMAALFVFHTPIAFFDLFSNFWLNYFLITIHSICVALFIETLCRTNVFWSTLVLALSIIAMEITDLDASTMFPYWIPPMNWSINLALPEFPSQLTGTFPRTELQSMVLYYQLGLSSLLFLVSYFFYSKRRSKSKASVSYLLLFTISFSLFSVGSYLFIHEYQGREKSYDELFVHPAIAEQQADLAAMLSPLGYTMNIQLNTASNHISCNTKLTFKNDSQQQLQQLPFTLKNSYEIHHIKDGRGQELQWNRNNDFVDVELVAPLEPGATMEVTIDYSGTPWEWFTAYDAQPHGLINFVSPSMTLLRSGHAWYPVLGKVPVYSRIDHPGDWTLQPTQVLSAHHVSHPTTAFTIHVQIDKDMEVITGLPLQAELQLAAGKKFSFFSPAAQDVFLLAAPYVKKAAPNLIIMNYYAKAHENSSDTVLAFINDRIAFYERLLPRNQQYFAIVEVPPFLLNSWQGETAERKRLGLQNAIPITEYLLNSVQGEIPSEQKLQVLLLEEAILTLWWPRFDTTEPGNISAGMLSYMHTLYQENKLGKEYYASVKEFWLQDQPPTFFDREREHAGGENLVIKETCLLLDAIRQSPLGDDGLKTFIQKVYATSLATYDHELNWQDMLHILDEFEEELLQKGYSPEQVSECLATPREKARYMNSLDLATMNKIRSLHGRIR